MDSDEPDDPLDRFLSPSVVLSMGLSFSLAKVFEWGFTILYSTAVEMLLAWFSLFAVSLVFYLSWGWIEE